MKVTNLSAADWKVEEDLVPKLAAVRRGSARRAGRSRDGQRKPNEVVPSEYLPEGASIAAAGRADVIRPNATRSAVAVERRPGATVPLELAIETNAADRVVLAVRLPSGALRFVAPVDRSTRGTRAAPTISRFVVPPPRGRPAARHRGVASDALKWVAVNIRKEAVNAVAGKAMRHLAAAAERRWWEPRREGLFRVASMGGALQLTPVDREHVHGPALLLLHGTFSHAASAFKDLCTAPGDFFAEAQRVYGEHIYAWDHFTVSKSPEDNARELLAALPASGVEFDVITHSRGGLVLRTLAERGRAFSDGASRFRLRRAVLVATPNEGTPLATPDRWEETLGFVANVMEIFPNPWTTGASFVADGLVWMAARLAGDLPGLASMDAGGATIAALQENGAVKAGSYAALAANFHPQEAIFQRLLDVGVDGFFQGANDLVVPAEGSWRPDGAGALIDGEKIACFGIGGNLQATTGVHHLNFFSQLATVEFLKRALGMPVGSAAPRALDPGTRLPTRSALRVSTRRAVSRSVETATFPVPPPRETAEVALRHASSTAIASAMPQTAYADRTLHLLILEAPPTRSVGSANPAAETKLSRRPKMIIATFSNARVVEVFPTQSPKPPRAAKGARTKSPPQAAPDLPGHRFQRIIRMHRRIQQCLNGEAGSDGTIPELPSDEELGDLGEWLFRSLFIGDVKRLYDVARGEQRGRPLNIVLTSAISWIAALPWEFAYDPMRRKYLASEEVHFTRSVMASVPAQLITRRSKKLRLLVVSAQPSDLSQLSIEAEHERIHHAFRSLTDSGLVEIQPLTDASAKTLQDHLMAEEVQGRSYDVVHFISHGEFERDGAEGRLLLVSHNGATQELEVRPLREMLCSRGIHLVFLNACETGVGYTPGVKSEQSEPSFRPARGIAQGLVEGGLPAVVANQYTVLDTAALGFADSFYRALALGASLGQAAREARIALNYAVDGEAIDWAVPVLYARDPDAVLCEPAAESRPQLPAAEAAVRPDGGAITRHARRAQRGSDRIRVGIADISKYFPQMAAILARLNAAQGAFDFVPVEVTIPLGVWEQKDWGPEEGGRIRYLWAERFARKIQHHPARLGVQYLICATNYLMRDNDTYNLYGWWSARKDCRIMLFSTGGMALPRDGDAAGRVVANAIVQALAAQIAQEAGAPNPIHEDGATDCPFYYNEERLHESVAGTNRFDAQCQQYLQTAVPETLFQIEREAILQAFGDLLTHFDTAEKNHVRPSAPSPNYERT